MVCCSLQECYVHNLLRVTTYIPSIRRDVLEVVIGKMLKLDVSGGTLWKVVMVCLVAGSLMAPKYSKKKKKSMSVCSEFATEL